jgi:hypothetical protein
MQSDEGRLNDSTARGYCRRTTSSTWTPSRWPSPAVQRLPLWHLLPPGILAALSH